MMKSLFSIAIFLGAICAVKAEVPKDYYSSCDGRSGQQLLSALNSLVGPHTTVSYDGLWSLYTTSDVDPNGKIWDMYSTKRWNTSEKCGSYSAVGSCYNREHSLPKSWFKEASPMKSDAFHVYPTDGKVNGQRSNYPFGECASGTTLSAPAGIKALGRLGTSTYPGYSGKVFEPDDEYKGDFARTYFYMAAAYNDRISSWNSDMLAGNKYPVFTAWAKEMLLKWHRQDPVSQKEIDRNNAVYAAQHNRNPFIDNPDMAEHIWGDLTSEPWHDTNSTPRLTAPANGLTVAFPLTSTGYSISRAIPLSGNFLTAPLTISCSDSRFTPSVTSIPAATVNAGKASLSVSFRSASAGKASAVLTLTSGTISVKVNLSAEAVEGIPLSVSGVTATSFTLTWLDLGDADSYTISITDPQGTAVAGFPRRVSASLEEYDVEDLDPQTTYTCTIASPSLSSTPLKVTTGQMLPSIQIIADGDIMIQAAPFEPSEAMELWLDIDNVEDPITLSVEAPFQLSANHTDWSSQITLPAQADRFYLRVDATEPGDYSSSILITSGDYTDDSTDVDAMVRDNSSPWWVEDFEIITGSTSYITGSITGSACAWNVVDVAFPSGVAEASEGSISARLGKTSASSLTTASAKRGGIGVIAFDLSRWSSSDGDITIAVEYSPDGKSWKEAGTVTTTSDSYSRFTIPVYASGDNFIRFRQTAGKRGNLDYITISDSAAGVDTPVAYEDAWDCYSPLAGTLTIDNHAPQVRSFMVYDLEGRVLANRSIAAGASLSLPLSTGFYLVSSDTLVRRVIVK